MAPERTPEDVRRDISRERQQLAQTVAAVRRGVPKVAAGALADVAALKTLKRVRRKS
jgi:hypothetical protein